MQCLDCQKQIVRGPRCKSCAAINRWAKRRGGPVKRNKCKTCKSPAKNQYCSLLCWHSSSEFHKKVGNRTIGRRVTKTCPRCKKNFTCAKSESFKMNFCSLKCRYDHVLSYGTWHGRHKKERWIGVCEHCGGTAKELALIHGRTEFIWIDGRHYTSRRNDYLELCTSCHRRYDYPDVKRKNQMNQPQRKPSR